LKRQNIRKTVRRSKEVELTYHYKKRRGVLDGAKNRRSLRK
jgi:hypothetical protein